VVKSHTGSSIERVFLLQDNVVEKCQPYVSALRAPSLATWLPPLACFSMWPLLTKDGLGLAYVGAIAVFIAVMGGGPPPPRAANDDDKLFSGGSGVGSSGSGGGGGRNDAVGRLSGGVKGGVADVKSGGPSGGGGGFFSAGNARLSSAAGDAAWRCVQWATALACVGAHAAAAFLPPPARLPYIHDLTFTSLAFLGFGAAAVYCNWRQWQVPADEDDDEGAGGEGGGRPWMRKQHVE
jgi:alpha-1,3-glucosyltransferase